MQRILESHEDPLLKHMVCFFNQSKYTIEHPKFQNCITIRRQLKENALCIIGLFRPISCPIHSHPSSLPPALK